MTEGPLVSLDKLTEPLTKLVEVVAAGMGTLYAPFGTVRQAKADAKAMIIRAKAEGKTASLKERAMSRLEHREMIRQQNLETITTLAANELPEVVSEKPVEKDWILQYLDHVEDISDEQMQTLWARILAGEVTSPGSYSKRTLEFLKTLDKHEAIAFSDFCCFALRDLKGDLFVFHNKVFYELLKKKPFNLGYETHFASIGLLISAANMINPSSLNQMRLSYFGRQYQLSGPQKPDDSSGWSPLEIPIWVRYFSVIGRQLANISGAVPVNDYIQRLSDSMNEENKVSFNAIATQETEKKQPR